MSRPAFCCSARFAAVASVALAASAAQAGISFYDWNLVVTGDLNSSSNVGGRVYVGGNLGGSASDYGFQLQASQWVGQDTLVVGGNITTNNINLQAGDLRVGGSWTGNLNLNGGGQLFQDNGLNAVTASLAAQMQAASVGYQNLQANSTVALPGPQPGQVVFNAAPTDGLAVFNVSGASIFSNPLTQTIELNTNGAAAIVVNVSGTTINFNSGNFDGAWNSLFARANVLWNFYEATSITLDRMFNGAILAPNATLTNSTNIEGSVFVHHFNQHGEVHLPSFTGFVIPGPAGLTILAAGLVFARGRRRAA